MLQGCALKTERVRRQLRERDHSCRLLLTMRVLFRYLIVKLNIFLGKLFRTLDHREEMLESEYLRIDEMTMPCDNSSWLLLSSWLVWMTFSACLVFQYWSYWISVWRLVSFESPLISLFGEDFNVSRIVVWHCMNLIDRRTRLIPYFDLLIIRLPKVALMGSSSHCPIYSETMLSRLSIIQVLLILAIVRYQESLDNRSKGKGGVFLEDKAGH